MASNLVGVSVMLSDVDSDPTIEVSEPTLSDIAEVTGALGVMPGDFFGAMPETAVDATLLEEMPPESRFALSIVLRAVQKRRRK